MAVLSFTGYYIHNPFIVSRAPSAYLMGTMRFIHVVAAFVFISSFLLRVYWFFVGNEWSRWRAFVPIHRQQWRGMGKMVKYYSFFRWNIEHHVGHNALAGAATYTLMFLLMFIEILSGLALYSMTVSNSVLSGLINWLPRLVDMQYLRLIHFCIMFTFFIFVIHHVYSAVLVSWEERNGLIESISAVTSSCRNRRPRDSKLARTAAKKEWPRAPPHMERRTCAGRNGRARPGEPDSIG